MESIDASSSNVILCILAISILLATIGIVCYVFQPALGQKPFDRDNIIQEQLHVASSNDIAGSNAMDRAYLLSLIIPAYNEEERLPPMLTSTIEYLHSNKDTIMQQCYEALQIKTAAAGDDTDIKHHCPFQIIIVNDGSSDETVKSIQDILQNDYHKKKDINQAISIKLLTLKQNSGKGAAVKAGMLHSKSKLSLMLDADGATTFSSLHSLLQQMKSSKACIAFGSRAHLQENSKAQRSLVRTLLMNAFHFFVEALIGGEICDTQCGFKLFRGEVVRGLFGNLHLQRWAFDTELVVIAERLGFGIVEVGVEW